MTENMRDEETKQFTDSILLDDKCAKIIKKVDPPSNRRRKGQVATSTVKLMSYITVKDIESETSYLLFLTLSQQQEENAPDSS